MLYIRLEEMTTLSTVGVVCLKTKSLLIFVATASEDETTLPPRAERREIKEKNVEMQSDVK